MGGLVLDYYVVFLFKLIARVIQTWGCSQWPMATAAVEIADPDYGGTSYPTAQVIYSYVIDGTTFEGRSRKPFIRYKSAGEYTAHFPQGSRITIRVKPDHPSISTILSQDQEALKLK
jgi:hypothetical protein